jgi:hypothetical protein
MTISLDALEKAQTLIKHVLDIRRSREQLQAVRAGQLGGSRPFNVLSLIHHGVTTASLVVDMGDSQQIVTILDNILRLRVETLREEIRALGVEPPPAEREPPMPPKRRAPRQETEESSRY